MLKNTLITFMLLGGFCYSQEINEKELEKLPPEFREKLLEALQDVKNKNNVVDEFTEEDFKRFEEKALAEKKKAKEKAVKPILPSQTVIEPIDKAKCLELISQLGANHFKIRKKAKLELIQMGYQILPLLKENFSKSNDPEISESIKEIVAKLSHRLHINQLDEKQQAVAKLPFEKGAVEGQNIKAEFYNNGEHFIIDVGLTRMVFPGNIKEISSSGRRSVNMILDGNSGGGGSSSSNNFKIYQYSYDRGVGYWTICGHSFTVSNYMLEIKKKKLNLKPDHPQILYFDKDYKAIGILDLK